MNSPRSVHDGDVFSRLTVVRFHHVDKHRQRHYECQCICGNTAIVNGNSLRKSNTRSCGCLLRTHGHSADYQLSPTYQSWTAMCRRCKYPDTKGFENYGGRGITITPNWLGKGGFAQFLADLGDRPEGKTLDRIDVNGNYEPDNCRWATLSEQRQNRRDS